MIEEMSEKERMEFWGELAVPITKMFGGMLLDGRYEWIKTVLAMLDKAESLKKASKQ